MTIDSESFNYPMNHNEGRYANRGNLRRSQSFAMPATTPKYSNDINSSSNLHRSLSRQSFVSEFQVSEDRKSKKFSAQHHYGARRKVS